MLWALRMSGCLPYLPLLRLSYLSLLRLSHLLLLRLPYLSLLRLSLLPLLWLSYLPRLRLLPRLLCVLLLHSPRPLFGRLLLLLVILIQLCVVAVRRRHPFSVSLGIALGTIHIVGMILPSRSFASIGGPIIPG